MSEISNYNFLRSSWETASNWTVGSSGLRNSRTFVRPKSPNVAISVFERPHLVQLGLTALLRPSSRSLSNSSTTSGHLAHLRVCKTVAMLHRGQHHYIQLSRSGVPDLTRNAIRHECTSESKPVLLTAFVMPLSMAPPILPCHGIETNSSKTTAALKRKKNAFKR